MPGPLPKVSDRPRFVANVAALSSITGKRDGDQAQTLGYTTAGDGGGNVYYWDDGSSATADGGFVITATGGRWVAADQTVANARQFGCTGDGSTDDTARLVAWAAATAKRYVLPGGTYKLDADTVEFSTADSVIECSGTISCTNGWYSYSAVDLLADRITLRGLRVVEASADPATASSGRGIDIKANYCTVEACEVVGFNYGFLLNGDGGDYTGANYRSCVASSAYGMGFFVDSCTNARYQGCVSHDNGLDGFKAGNNESRTCEGLTYSQCEAFLNGQRDIAAGGSENTNGNGWDVYHGGYRFTLSQCYGHDNYGAGFNIKDPASVDQVMGEGFLIGCTFTGGKTLNNGSEMHGVEINQSNNGTGGSLIHVIGCNCSDNDGWGISIGGGFGHRVIGGNVLENASGGIRLADNVVDFNLDGVVLAGNTSIGIQVGSGNDSSFVNKRGVINGVVVYGNYDSTTDPGDDPKDWATSAVTTHALRCYNDSAGITIRDLRAYNCTSTSGTVYISSADTLLDRCYVYGADRLGIGVWTGATGVVIRETTVEETDFSGSTSFGSFYVNGSEAAIIDCKAVQSGSTSGARPYHFHTSALDGCKLRSFVATNVPNPTLGTANAHVVTAASPTLELDLPTYIDSSSNAVNATLGSGEYVGQPVTIVMTNASNSSTVTVTNHETSDPEVFTFDAVDECLVLIWTGTEWATLKATATT